MKLDFSKIERKKNNVDSRNIEIKKNNFGRHIWNSHECITCKDASKNLYKKVRVKL